MNCALDLWKTFIANERWAYLRNGAVYCMSCNKFSSHPDTIEHDINCEIYQAKELIIKDEVNKYMTFCEILDKYIDNYSTSKYALNLKENIRNKMSDEANNRIGRIENGIWR